LRIVVLATIEPETDTLGAVHFVHAVPVYTRIRSTIVNVRFALSSRVPAIAGALKKVFTLLAETPLTTECQVAARAVIAKIRVERASYVLCFVACFSSVKRCTIALKIVEIVNAYTLVHAGIQGKVLAREHGAIATRFHITEFSGSR